MSQLLYKVIQPAFLLLRPLSILQKVVLLLLLSFLPFSYMFFKFYNLQSTKISTTQKEIQGVKLNHLLFTYITDIQKLRGMDLNIRLGNQNFTQEMKDQRTKIKDVSYQKLLTYIQQYHEYHYLADIITTSFQELNILASAPTTNTKDALLSFQAHSHIIETLNEELKKVNLISTLSLDPVAQSFYAYHISYVTVPPLVEVLGKLRAVGSTSLSNNSQNVKDLSSFISLNILHIYAENALEQEIVFYSNLKNNTHKKISLPTKTILHNELHEITNQLIISKTSKTPHAFFTMTTQLINTYLTLYQQLHNNLLNDLELRLQSQNDQLNFYLSISLLLLLIVIYIFMSIAITLHKNVRSLVAKTEDIAHAHYHEISLECFANDEFSAVAKGLNELTGTLQSNHNVINQFVLYSKTDLYGKIVEVSESFCQLTGFTQEELLGKTHAILRSDKTPKHFYKEMWATLKNNGTFEGEFQNLKKNHDPFWINIIIHPLYDTTQKKIGYMAYRHDISSQKIAEKLAITDPLTQLYNRQFFDAHLAQSLENFKRTELPTTLFMLDIDHFKKINDTFGHLQGDLVLKELALLFNKYFRDSDAIARWGGEEFMVLLHNSSFDTACTRIKIFCNTVETSKINGEDQVTLSVGATPLRVNDTMETLLSRVDALLYQAKENGRNRVSCEGTTP